MRLIVVLLFALIVSACGDTIINVPSSPSSITPTPTPTPTPTVNFTTIELRVIGNPTSVRIRYSNPIDGLVQVITALPFEASYTTTNSSLFVSLDATPISFSPSEHFPFMSVQIIVNGVLFREASSNDFSFTPLIASGTWRK